MRRKHLLFLRSIIKNHVDAVIEAGRNWGMMYDLLEELDIKTVVAHPLKIRAIADAKIKSDSIDAKTLAHLLRADLIPQVHVPPKEVREQKNLLRHRLWLVRLQTMTKNRIHQLIEKKPYQKAKCKEHIWGCWENIPSRLKCITHRSKTSERSS